MSGVRVFLLAVAALAATMVLGVACAESPDASTSNKPTPAAIKTSLQSDLRYLASDELRGRSVTDDTIDVAADFIAKRMASIGLQTDSIDGTPFQPVEVNVGSEVGSAEKNQLTFRTDNGDGAPVIDRLSLDNGFSPLAIGVENASFSAPVAFVGYGITAPKIGYDDYKGIDTNGKAVIVIRKEPQLGDPESPFDGTSNSRHAFFATKVSNAVRHGATAVLIVNDESSIRDAVKEEENRRQQELDRRDRIAEQLKNLPIEAKKNRAALEEQIKVVGDLISQMENDIAEARRGVLGISQAGGQVRGKKIPVVSIARDVAQRLIQQASGKTLSEIEAGIDKNLKPSNRDLPNVRVSVDMEIKPAIAKTKNVIGVLPGKGSLAGETIVVGAHYDHVGMGGYGSLAPGTIAIHNGADDNASGTSTLLACAELTVARLRTNPNHRTVVFVAFTGEERGLIGSAHYVKSPLRPLDTTAAMINLDMVGRLRDNELTVYGTGTADSLDSLVETANQNHQFKLYKVASGYGPSDHQSFYVAGVPVLFFFTGLHNDYHRPTDDYEKIDFDDLTRIALMVGDVTGSLATAAQRPVYAQTNKSVSIRRQMTAYLGVSLSDRQDHVVLSSVTPDSPADAGGLQVGDRLVKLQNQSIRSSDDVLIWLRKKSPKDKVVITVLRNGQQEKLTVELGERP